MTGARSMAMQFPGCVLANLTQLRRFSAERHRDLTSMYLTRVERAQAGQRQLLAGLDEASYWRPVLVGQSYPLTMSVQAARTKPVNIRATLQARQKSNPSHGWHGRCSGGGGERAWSASFF